MSNEPLAFASLTEVVTHLRITLENKKYILLYAYNGTGKTRLSMAFKDAGKNDDERDTLYFNAFTEDLFSWDNDLDGDSKRVLRINKESRFFDGLQELEMETRIRPLLQRYADFDFLIDYSEWTINFVREISVGNVTQPIEHIKVSRGEENIFVWCFFLAVAQLAVDEQEAYSWVKFLYIDDPISSLDDNNAIVVASHLAIMLKRQTSSIKIIISSHHTLFFNVLCNELGKAEKYFLSKGEESQGYQLRSMYGDTARFYHVAMLKELKQAADSENLFTYHFNILRSLLEKTAAFHGYTDFGDCIKQDEDDVDGIIHKRIVSLLNHDGYSLFEPVRMLDENKRHFKNILNEFMGNYRFNSKIFIEQP